MSNTDMDPDKFRVVEVSATNSVTGEVHKSYYVQERVRLVRFLPWPCIWGDMSEEVHPGYYKLIEFQSEKQASDFIDRVIKWRAWRPIEESVIKVIKERRNDA